VLGRLGEAAARHPQVLPALLAALHDPAQDVRWLATEALGEVGEAVARHPQVLPALLAALHDPAQHVRRKAAEALERLGEAAARHPEVLPALLAALHDSAQDVRWRAARALGRLMGENVRIFKTRWGKWKVRNIEELTDESRKGRVKSSIRLKRILRQALAALRRRQWATLSGGSPSAGASPVEE